ncbi:MAG TPA: fimbria/pilus outer membrane usher protein, partial [Gammaproteobacteria bacterium]
LSPGEFEFLNVGTMQGSGEATLVIKDAYGGEERITVPYYTSAQLLKPGLHDYSYSVGYQREAFGEKSAEYGDAAFLGYHRIGFTDALTAGLRAEADADVTNGGASATFLLGTLGEFDTALAFSRDNGGAGRGWSARYSRSSRYVSGGLFARGFSRDYATLTMASSDDKARLETSVNLGLRQERLGSVSFFYTLRDMYQEVDRRRYGVNYNRRLASQVSLNIVAARTVAETATNELFANLMILLGRSRSANVSLQKQGEESAARVSLQQNAPLGTGFGYRLSGDWRDNDQSEPTSGGNAYLQYRGNHGVYSAEHRIIDGTSNYMAGTAGSIAFINRSAYFTRPIYDGFVLAKVGAFENVTVSYNHQPVGVTDKNGELLIPGLLSYYSNSVSIDDKAIPVNYELAEITKSVSLPYRAGGVVNFGVKKLQGFTGRLAVREGGEQMPAEYWGLQFSAGGKVNEVIVGKRGEFYLENLPAGRYPARLFNKENSCSFALVIPDSDDAMVDMGEVICE